jgi:hypothetical protein
MDDPRLTRSYLEGLSSDELIRLADRHGIDIPFGLERIFIIEELLDFVLDDVPGITAVHASLRSGFKEATSLPRQYNISFVEAMIRDPLWAFVFWEIKSYDRELHEKAVDFEGYCLRAVPLAGAAGECSFTVPVGVDDCAWYLGFPPEEGRRSYMVELCALRAKDFIPLAVSRRFRLPALVDPSGGSGRALYQNPLAALSGVHDFLLVRSADRLSRSRGV